MTPTRTDAAAVAPTRAGGVLGGAALLATAQIVSRAITMVFTLVVARLMSVGDFGAMNLALTLVVVFALLQDLGLSRTVVKEVARQPQDAAEWIGRLVTAKLLLALLAALALPLLAAMAGYDGSLVLLLVVAATMLPGAAVWLLLENATQAVGAVRLLAGITVFNAALQTALGLAAAVTSDGDPRALVAAMAVSGLVSTALLWRRLVRHVGPIRPSFDRVFVRRTIVASLPYLSVAFAVAALGRVELILLARLEGDAAAGVFAAAFKLFEAALFVLYAMQIAMNPVLARLVLGERAALERWLGWEFGLLAAGVVPLAVAAAWLATPLIALLYPPDYAEAGTVLAVLVAALPVVGLQVFTAGVLVLTDRRREVFLLNLAVLAAQVVIALLLIPPLGAPGAAVALACSQAVAALLGVALVRRHLVGAAAFSGALRVLAVAVAALAAGLAVRQGAGDAAAAGVALLLWAAGLALVRFRARPPL
jgi:O-antigen/teichoic acid export membrane protein